MSNLERRVIHTEIKDDIIMKLVEDSGATREAIGTIKDSIQKISDKLEGKADDCSLVGINSRVEGLEDDLKPFRPVGKFIQKNTAFILLCFMVVICVGILNFKGMI